MRASRFQIMNMGARIRPCRFGHCLGSALTRATSRLLRSRRCLRSILFGSISAPNRSTARWRSLITGLSLSLLLRADAAWLPALAAVIAITSKFTLRVDGKHVFNPAGFAIVVLLLATREVWISPGQWGASVYFAALTAFFAILVLRASQRSDIALFFLASHAALLVGRAAWLGDPLAIPLHQLQSGSLLIFTFFMISDPRTTPDSRLGRFLFALAVALLAHYLAFFMQMRPALYVALIALSPVTLLLDRFIPGKQFAWTPAPQGASQ
jgi:Na+-transporting NADH:ubiquinone oxidoreductase subunit NqrB